MAKGYPVRQEADVIPECPACGSGLFHESRRGLRCDDCGALMHEPFALPN
jgi:tRNA(Ile2) C34 agmatinyltransferase TiaS